MARAAVRQMLLQGAGDVVFVSSLSGRRAPRADPAVVYAATKHAITVVAEGLRMDVHEKGLHVTNVEPGLVRTEFPESSYASAQEYYAEKEYPRWRPQTWRRPSSTRFDGHRG